MKIWLDGKLVDKQDAKLSVFDHGTLYGDGVFEGIRVYGGRIFQCDAHIDRLFDSAKRIRLAIPRTKPEIVEAMVQTVRANDIRDGYIRLVVTRGEGALGISPIRCPAPAMFIIADQIHLFPKNLYETGMAVIIAKTVRTSPQMLDPGIKSLNYLNSILGKIEAIDAGVEEAIMLNDKGNVAEGTADNIFIVQAGGVVTPPLSAGVLPGVTRAVVMSLARKMGIPVAEENVSPTRLLGAQECFLTGTAAEVIAVTRVDDKPIGDGAVGLMTRRLTTAFHEYIKSGQW